jgi:hypothetical protein
MEKLNHYSFEVIFMDGEEKWISNNNVSMNEAMIQIIRTEEKDIRKITIMEMSTNTNKVI